MFAIRVLVHQRQSPHLPRVTLVVETGRGVHGAALDRMDAVCPGGAVELIATLPGALLTRLNWDDQCREALAATGDEGGAGGAR